MKKECILARHNPVTEKYEKIELFPEMSEPFFRQVPEITEQYSVAAFPTTFIFKVNE
jgi:hypothetical protein